MGVIDLSTARYLVSVLNDWEVKFSFLMVDPKGIDNLPTMQKR